MPPLNPLGGKRLNCKIPQNFLVERNLPLYNQSDMHSVHQQENPTYRATGAAPRQSVRRQWIAWLLLAAALLIGSLTAGWGSFSDEGDNLAIGDLLLRGGVLYRDLFTHHFPFAYYWTAASIALVGKSIYALRLLVWFFQILTFAVAMWASRWHLPLGIAALLWSASAPLYFGNHIVYYIFGACSMLVVAVTTLAVLCDRVQFTWRRAGVVGICGVIALLSNPLLAYALGIAFLFLASKDWRRALASAGVSAICLLLYAGWLAAAGDWAAFWQSAIVFNSDIYAKYLGDYARPGRFAMLLDNMRHGLGLLEPEWRNFDPLAPVLDYYQFERWSYTGLAYRFVLLAGSVLLLVQRRWRAGLFLFVSAAAALLPGAIGARIQYLALLALFVMGALISQEWWPWRSNGRQQLAAAAVSVAVAVLAFWPALRAADFVRANSDRMEAMAHFADYELQAQAIRDAVCGQTDVALAWYPDNTYRTWFSGLAPLGGYTIMWPWVAETGLPEILPLAADPAAKVLAVTEEQLVWNRFDTNEYLKPFYDFVRNNYVDLGGGWYLSPAAAAGCSP
jgi:hypothetical protein